MFLINTLLGFLVMQIYDVLSRQKPSPDSPVKFSLKFFFKDTWQKIVLSLVLSMTLSLVVFLNVGEIEETFGADIPVNNLIYLIIGAVPEWLLQKLKKRFGVMQPTQVEGYQRKQPK